MCVFHLEDWTINIILLYSVMDSTVSIQQHYDLLTLFLFEFLASHLTCTVVINYSNDYYVCLSLLKREIKQTYDDY